jgi:hypothetical protein
MTWPHEQMQPLRFVYAGKERKLKVKQLVGLNGYTALLTTDGQGKYKIWSRLTTKNWIPLR